MFGFSSNHSFHFFFAVSCTQRFEADEAFLPLSLDGSIFSTFDFIALLLQLLQKIFVAFRLAGQNGVDHAA